MKKEKEENYAMAELMEIKMEKDMQEEVDWRIVVIRCFDETVTSIRGNQNQSLASVFCLRGRGTDGLHRIPPAAAVTITLANATHLSSFGTLSQQLLFLMLILNFVAFAMVVNAAAVATYDVAIAVDIVALNVLKTYVEVHSLMYHPYLPNFPSPPSLLPLFRLI